MKKTRGRWAAVIAFIALCAAMTGCGHYSQVPVETTVVTAESPTESRQESGREEQTTAAEAADEPSSEAGSKSIPATETQAELTGWKKAYIDYLQTQDPGRWQGFHLIYVDDDEIPELAMVGIAEAEGCIIVSYGSDGTVHETHLDRLYFTYIERENLLCNSEGLMDHYYDLVYSMKDGRLTRIAAGYYGKDEDAQIELDANGFPIFHYQYQWDGVVMSEEEYTKAYNAVYDTAKAKVGYDIENLDSLEEVMQAIRDIR